MRLAASLTMCSLFCAVVGDCSQGAEVVDGKVIIPDLNAAIGWALGLPLEEEFTAASGQVFHIANDGKPITQLFS